jgi:serine/threonine protein phosphatase 1
MALLKHIQFNPLGDTIYILGDVIDRGAKPIESLIFIMETKKIHFIIGNHEQIMFDYLDGRDKLTWLKNGYKKTLSQLKRLTGSERDKILSYLRSRPYYQTITIEGKKYFLSHAGLDVSLPFNRQPHDALIWSREEFYENKGLAEAICIFGHTPTPNLHDDPHLCSVWFDPRHNDKICIDCGCVYGGALSAIRLDDGKIFYVKSSISKRGYRIHEIQKTAV